MTLWTEETGAAEALRRIAACGEARAEELDLGGLRLTTIPPQLYELTWLKRLYLGADADARKQPYFGYNEHDKKRCNALGALPGALFTALAHLVLLDVAHNGLRSLPRELFGLTGLTTLDLTRNSIGADGARALAALTGLTTLNLGGNEIGADGARALAALTGLTTLNLGGNAIGDDGARALAALTGLTALDLGSNQIGADGARALAALTGLTALDLRGNAIGADGARVLAALTGLTTLDLTRNAIGADGARALAALTGLTTLDLGYNKIGDDGARALAALTGLTTLDLRNNQIGDDGARALAALTGLTTLDLRNNQIGDDGARALAALTGLTTLYLGFNQIGADGARALAALTGLTTLDLRYNRIAADGARALAALTGLTTLDLWVNEIGADGARALAALTGLTTLDLGGNSIGADGARALAALTGLTTLDLWHNQIGADGARALAALTGLTTLDLRNNQIGDDGARALAALTGLTTLDLGSNGIGDISGLLALDRLEKLKLSKNTIEDACPALWLKPSLREVYLEDATLGDVPRELLSKNSYDDNCLDRLRAYFADKSGGTPEIVRDVKAMILGNGRIGKTQIARQLRGETFEKDALSTHGVQVREAVLPAPEGSDGSAQTPLHIWDFGGQDLYLGTHALFLRTRAIFPIVWTPKSEAEPTHTYAGVESRNLKLDYWVAYVAQMAGTDKPVVLIQNRCDGPEDRREPPGVPAELLRRFAFQRDIVYSAKTRRGHPTLVDTLQQAVAHLHRAEGLTSIGGGWAKVKTRLEAQREEAQAAREAGRVDPALAAMEFAAFEALCAKPEVVAAGGVSQPRVLLGYLHDIGTVFYRDGLFGGRIIVDQQWALDAIYAAFERASGAYTQIRDRQHGRFTRSDLGRLLWNDLGHGPDEQALFLSMMKQCGICFELKAANEERKVEAVYVAPDLLPPPSGMRLELLEAWSANAGSHEAEFAFDVVPPGLLRTLMATVGGKAGLDADYWDDGFYFYDAATQARAIVEQDRTEGQWDGSIRIATQRRGSGGDPAALLANLCELVEAENQKLGVTPKCVTGRPGVGPLAGAAVRSPESGSRAAAPLDQLQIAIEPSGKSEYFVSYAHGSNLTEVDRVRARDVDRFCEDARAKGVEVLRDINVIKFGDRISDFMGRLVHGKKVYVFLSDKYFHSYNCMFELSQLYAVCDKANQSFLDRVQVFALPCANFYDALDRDDLRNYWRAKLADYDRRIKEQGVEASDDLWMHARIIRGFVENTSRILALVADTLHPTQIEHIDGLPLD